MHGRLLENSFYRKCSLKVLELFVLINYLLHIKGSQKNVLSKLRAPAPPRPTGWRRTGGGRGSRHGTSDVEVRGREGSLMQAPRDKSRRMGNRPERYQDIYPWTGKDHLKFEPRAFIRFKLKKIEMYFRKIHLDDCNSLTDRKHFYDALICMCPTSFTSCRSMFVCVCGGN